MYADADTLLATGPAIPTAADRERAERAQAL